MDAKQEPEPSVLESARQRRAGLRRAMVALEEAVARPAHGREAEWIAEMGNSLAGLQGAFDAHIEITEAPDGLFAEIVQMAPRLANAAKRLEKEHPVISRRVEDAMASFAGAPATPDDEWVAARRDAVTELLGLIVRHRQKGADLTYEAYEVEIGGES